MSNISGKIAAVELPKPELKNFLVTVEEDIFPLTMGEAKDYCGEDASMDQVMKVFKAAKTPTYKKVWIAKGMVAKPTTGDKASPISRVSEQAPGSKISFSFLNKDDSYKDSNGELKVVEGNDKLVNYDTLIIV